MARQSEIKHGRVSVAAFVGYCVQVTSLSVGHDFGWNTLPSTDLSPPERWMFSHSQTSSRSFSLLASWNSLRADPGEGSGGGTHALHQGQLPGRIPLQRQFLTGIQSLSIPLVFPQKATPEEEGVAFSERSTTVDASCLASWFPCAQTIRDQYHSWKASSSRMPEVITLRRHAFKLFRALIIYLL
jgi:hypothetical protein